MPKGTATFAATTQQYRVVRLQSFGNFPRIPILQRIQNKYGSIWPTSQQRVAGKAVFVHRLQLERTDFRRPTLYHRNKSM